MFRARSRITADTSLTFAVSGDSVTARPESWRDQIGDRRLRLVGGFAEDDATSERAFGQVRRSLADVLVVMLGMNDVRQGVPFEEMTANIEKIVRFAECQTALLCLVPPSNHSDGAVNQRANGVVANRHLFDLGARRGWVVADPFAFARASNNSWGGGSSDDGTHPLPHVSTEAAVRMRLFIRQAAATTGLNQ
ncbi:SGNH/GDSL hydrolase family protein [Curtobacterium sp. PhB115]|uniref:SGNH/GDSL hydrolase family protein n=1 Tax=Curtobacterium sp. PhB115 TaxID=2485173 RepID=UPI000F4AFB74|nr:SGNH/GDSL hydrolase family protein [Curtobacterium sp. PhB115]ROP63990.1 GDSL-like lipase/acylhydrolase family protein [Curtobacterium sp. PhB115]